MPATLHLKQQQHYHKCNKWIEKTYKNDCSLLSNIWISIKTFVYIETRRSFAIRAISSRTHVIKIISICIDLIKWASIWLWERNERLFARDSSRFREECIQLCCFLETRRTQKNRTAPYTYSISYKVHERSTDMAFEF